MYHASPLFTFIILSFSSTLDMPIPFVPGCNVHCLLPCSQALNVRHFKFQHKSRCPLTPGPYSCQLHSWAQISHDPHTAHLYSSYTSPHLISQDEQHFELYLCSRSTLYLIYRRTHPVPELDLTQGQICPHDRATDRRHPSNRNGCSPHYPTPLPQTQRR